MHSRKTTVVPMDYQGQPVRFNTDGWINATEAGKRFGKRPVDWLRLPDTVDYITALAESLGLSKVGKSHFGLVKTQRGGKAPGTWFHPKLGVPYARWLEVRFSIWCDEQIDRLIHGEQDDWQHLRDSAAIGYQGMCDALSLSRQAQGKASKPHHYMCEAKLINGVLFGRFKGVDRDTLTPAQLRLLALLEQRNIFLLGQGMDYAPRRKALTEYVEQLLRPRLKGGAA